MAPGSVPGAGWGERRWPRGSPSLQKGNGPNVLGGSIHQAVVVPPAKEAPEEVRIPSPPRQEAAQHVCGAARGRPGQWGHFMAQVLG